MNYSQHLGITTGQVEGLGYDRPGARRMSDLLNRLIDDAIHYESRSHPIPSLAAHTRTSNRCRTPPVVCTPQDGMAAI